MSSSRIALSPEHTAIHAEPVVVLRVESKGPPAPIIVTLGLQEQGRTIKAKVWHTLRPRGVTTPNPVAEFVLALEPGTPVTVTGKIVPGYKEGPLEFDLLEIAPLPMDHPIVQAATARPATPVDDLTRQWDALLYQIKGPTGDFVRGLLGPEGIYREEFIASPAALSNHHNYTGGLLEHTLEVTNGALALVGYPEDRDTFRTWAQEIALLPPVWADVVARLHASLGVPQDDLAPSLVAAARGLGKVYSGPAGLVDEGLLVAAAMIAATPVPAVLGPNGRERLSGLTSRVLLLQRSFAGAEGAPALSADERDHLIHALVSVYGDAAAGSPTPPKTPEAMLLHAAMKGRTLAEEIAPTELEGDPRLASRDIFLAGAMLHDIGKLREYRLVNGAPDMTSQSELFGHLTSGAMMVQEAADRMDPPLDPAIVQEILHYVVSHHGQLDWGSPTVPATSLAAFLHAADYASARLAPGLRALRLTGKPLNDRRHGLRPSPRVAERLEAIAAAPVVLEGDAPIVAVKTPGSESGAVARGETPSVEADLLAPPARSRAAGRALR